MREPTANEVSRAAVTWCGEKDRETFSSDIEYFRNKWRYLPGLRAYVEREVEASDLRAVLGEALARQDTAGDVE